MPYHVFASPTYHPVHHCRHVYAFLGKANSLPNPSKTLERFAVPGCDYGVLECTVSHQLLSIYTLGNVICGECSWKLLSCRNFHQRGFGLIFADGFGVPQGVDQPPSEGAYGQAAVTGGCLCLPFAAISLSAVGMPVGFVPIVCRIVFREPEIRRTAEMQSYGLRQL